MAKLAAVVDSLEGVAEPLRDMYAPRDDGKYILQLEGPPPGFVEAARLAEFRQNNSALGNRAKELEAALKAYEGIDPEAARKALAAEQEQAKAIEAKKLLKAEDVQALIDRAVTPLAQQIEAEKSARAKAEQSLAEKVVNEGIVAAARKAGELNPGSEDLLVLKARAAGWTTQDGKLVQQQDGQPVYSKRDAGQLRSIDEWVAEEAVTALGRMWKPSVGGGSSGSRAPVGPNVIAFTDRERFRKNLDKVAKGELRVEMPQ
jgi:hypothetical protein